MMLALHDTLRAHLRHVLTEVYGLDAETLPSIAVESPPNRALGDLAVTVAFELARTLRKAPRIIAREIVEGLGAVDGVARADAAPSGYVNLYLDRPAWLRRALAAGAASQPTAASQPAAAAPKTIVEHTAINPNKAAHIGHLRNSALGDTLVRLLRFQGHAVETQNYIDDTGVQVADVVVGFQQLETRTLDDVRRLADETRFDYYCWDLYARVTEWYEGDRQRLDARARALRDLEHGRNETAEMARFIAERIVRLHLATMDRLNVDYDLLSWESDILRLDFWATAFDILKAAGAVSLAAEGKQAGCWVMPIDGAAEDEAPETPAAGEAAGARPRTKVIVRSNGTVTYVGKDIAYQFWKFGVLGKDFPIRRYGSQRSGRALWTTGSAAADPAAGAPPAFGRAAAVYNVIDTRQSYLQQLLKQALAAVGHTRESERSIHFSYEMVALSHATARALGYDADASAGRPFVEVSGRKGLGVKADDLLDRVSAAARTEVRARNPALDDAEADRIAAVIGTAAVRYFMIKYSRGKVIAFDIDEALSFEGESGPYLQYAAVRATNILEKLRARDGTDEQAVTAALPDLPPAALADPEGTDLWALALDAARLDEVVEQAVRSLELSVLAKYAFGLAQAFNTFYHRCPVISEDRRDVRLWRAAVVVYVRRQLTRALHLMGCEVPPRM